MLTGTVQSPIDATRAGEIATQVIGVDPNAPPDDHLVVSFGCVP